MNKESCCDCLCWQQFKKKKCDINIVIFWYFSFEQLQLVTSDQMILFFWHFEASAIFFVYYNCTHKMSELYVTELQQRMLAKRQQEEIWLACKQKSILLCLMYVKHQIMLMKNTTLYFIELFILWRDRQDNSMTDDRAQRHWQEHESIQKIQKSEKFVFEFIWNSYLLYYMSLRVQFKVPHIDRLLWHMYFGSWL